MFMIDKILNGYHEPASTCFAIKHVPPNPDHLPSGLREYSMIYRKILKVHCFDPTTECIMHLLMNFIC